MWRKGRQTARGREPYLLKVWIRHIFRERRRFRAPIVPRGDLHGETRVGTAVGAGVGRAVVLGGHRGRTGAKLGPSDTGSKTYIVTPPQHHRAGAKPPEVRSSSQHVPRDLPYVGPAKLLEWGLPPGTEHGGPRRWRGLTSSPGSPYARSNCRLWCTRARVWRPDSPARRQ